MILANSGTLILSCGNIPTSTGIISDTRIFVAENLVIDRGTITYWHSVSLLTLFSIRLNIR